VTLGGIDRREWATATDGRLRSAFVIHHAAAHAVEVHECAGCPLTPSGIASCAASAAVVLGDPAHPNHERIMQQAMARAEREAS
jgi:hypothetical protein